MSICDGNGEGRDRVLQQIYDAHVNHKSSKEYLSVFFLIV